MANFKINHKLANKIRLDAFWAKTAWTTKAITAVIVDKDAFAKASDTATLVVVRWMIHHPNDVATLVATNAAAFDFAVAVLTAAAPYVTAVASDIDYDPTDHDKMINATDADAALVKDIVDNHNAVLLASAISDIFYLPTKADIMSAMT